VNKHQFIHDLLTHVNCERSFQPVENVLRPNNSLNLQNYIVTIITIYSVFVINKHIYKLGDEDVRETDDVNGR